MKIKYIIILFAIITNAQTALCCTSAIVSGSLTRDGRPLLWKHRDTGTEHNFIEKVAATASNQLSYIALFNGGDSLLREAWMGMNEEGFAIMNTASYNLAPDTTDYKDREGLVMSLALSRCHSLKDFETLLDTLPKPLGVQANFGVIDANGKGAYYETDDYTYVKYALEDAENGILIRTNFSCSGDADCGMGYIRENNAKHLLAPYIQNGNITVETFTDNLSKSFYHSLFEKDFLASGEKWAVDQDFIPRYSSSASIVIEGVNPGEDIGNYTMWTAIGYPPCSQTIPVKMTSIPETLRPIADGWRSPECNRVLELKRKAFPIERGSGKRYIDMDFIRSVVNYGKKR